MVIKYINIIKKKSILFSKRSVAFLLGFLMLFSSLLGNISMAQETTGEQEGKQLKDFLDEIQITDSEGNEIKDGPLTFGEEYNITMWFSESDGSSGSGPEGTVGYRQFEEITGSLTYQLPLELKIQKLLSGYLYDPAGEEIGSYTITRNGEVTLDFKKMENPKPADPSNPDTGYYYQFHKDTRIKVEMKARVDVGETETDDTVEFENGQKFTVDTPEPEFEIQKEGLYYAKDGSIYYEIDVLAVEGFTRQLTIADKISKNGDQTGITLDESSIKVELYTESSIREIPRGDDGTSAATYYKLEEGVQLPNFKLTYYGQFVKGNRLRVRYKVNLDKELIFSEDKDKIINQASVKDKTAQAETELFPPNVVDKYGYQDKLGGNCFHFVIDVNINKENVDQDKDNFVLRDYMATNLDFLMDTLEVRRWDEETGRWEGITGYTLRFVEETEWLEAKGGTEHPGKYRLLEIGNLPDKVALQISYDVCVNTTGTDVNVSNEAIIQGVNLGGDKFDGQFNVSESRGSGIGSTGKISTVKWDARTNEVLSGAGFELYTTNSKVGSEKKKLRIQDPETGEIHTYYVYSVGTLEASNGIGTLESQDIMAGHIFFLVEKKAPANYWLPQGEISDPSEDGEVYVPRTVKETGGTVHLGGCVVFVDSGYDWTGKNPTIPEKPDYVQTIDFSTDKGIFYFGDYEKKGSLSISKQITPEEGKTVTEEEKEEEFIFSVETSNSVDESGKPKWELLPKGTKYIKTTIETAGSMTTLPEPNDEVSEAGEIKVKHGEQVLICGLPEGTKYRVKETEESRGTYSLQYQSPQFDYTDDYKAEIVEENGEYYVTGIVQAGDRFNEEALHNEDGTINPTVLIRAGNSPNSVELPVPIRKILANANVPREEEKDFKFQFEISRVTDSTGEHSMESLGSVEIPFGNSKDFSGESIEKTHKTVLTYSTESLKKEESRAKQPDGTYKFYYLVKEVETPGYAKDIEFDTSAYTFEVTVKEVPFKDPTSEIPEISEKTIQAQSAEEPAGAEESAAEPDASEITKTKLQAEIEKVWKWKDKELVWDSEEEQSLQTASLREARNETFEFGFTNILLGEYQLLVIKNAETIKSGETPEPLAGAGFKIYEDEECTKLAAGVVIDGRGGQTDDERGALTDENGKLKFLGLCSGKTYWLKEVYSPTGYGLAKAVKIEIRTGGGGTVVVEGAPKEVSGNEIQVTITDRRVNMWIPFTAGIGNYGFIVAGVLIMCIACLGMFLYRSQTSGVCRRRYRREQWQRRHDLKQ